MNRSVFRVGLSVLLAVVLCMAGANAFAQGGTTQTLSGTVADTSGFVIPGADVIATHNGTGVASSSVSNAEGLFSLPSLPIGTYTVTVTLQGFKTFVVQNVVLTSGAGASVKAIMEIGGVSEQITVTSSSEIVQTQSSTVSTTINTNQITKLPLTSRSALDFVNMLPGVSTPAGNRQATINGLPRGMINITLDGVNVQDNTNRTTDGFFAIVSPRLDAIEEVTVTTASQGVGDAGQGAVQIKFVTRGGTNNFSGSGYHYYRNDKLNANTWFNNRDGVAKAKLLQNQTGFRIGGPIVIPGLFDGRNKAFFFGNYEELRQPSDVTRNRTILNPGAMAGNFTYTVSGVPTTVNVLNLAAGNGQVSSQDPIVQKLMSDIRSAVSGGSLADTDGNLQRFTYNVPVQSKRLFPTFRLDYNLSNAHRASFAYNYQKFTDFPDTLNSRDASFPGFPVAAGQSSVRLGWAGSVRSTLGRDLVNEARVGYSGAPVSFFSELDLGMYTGSVANQGGFQLGFPAVGSALTSPSIAAIPQSRNANSFLLEDTVNWLKGAHSVSMGVSFTQFDIWAKNSSLLPSITFGVLPNDPALGLFSAANFPGASAADLTAASNLYALLTGRVTSIGADARLDEAGKYVYQGVGLQQGRLRETGVFLQDQWRLRQNVTLNAGIRYDVQLPFYPLNSLYSKASIQQVCGVSGAKDDASCNLFQSGAMPGARSTYSKYEKGSKAYNTDYNNIAPSLGMAWAPAPRSGLLGGLMGTEGDFVIRGGFTRSFSRPGLGDFTGRLNLNPGIVIDASRNAANGLLGAVPLLLRETSRLGSPVINNGSETPVYPLVPVILDSINTFDPNLQVPYADSWSAGIQRGVTRNMALEVRYVGTRGKASWANLNYNEFNIFENDFLKEFRQAQANLQANISAGRGNTFAFTGAPGTAALPTFLAFFNGQSSANAANSALYTGTNWTNSTFLGFLAALNPQPFNFANAGGNGLMGTAAFRANAAAAGLPANFFIANPNTLGGANVTRNLSDTKYNSLQVELRRRLSQGLQFQSSYVFGHGFETSFRTLRKPQFFVRDAGTPGDITHQFKANAVYDLPFGRGRRFGGNANGFVDRVIGGWQISVVSKAQSGLLVDLGNIRMVGMSKNDVAGMFGLRFDNAGKQVYSFPKDVIDNTILAFAVSATTPSGYAGAAPTGRYFAPANGPDCIEVNAGATYGDCASRSLVVTGPLFQQHDLRVSKRTAIVGRVNIEFAAELLNALNQPNFFPVSGIGSSTLTGYQLTGLTGTNASRVIQLVSRINW